LALKVISDISALYSLSIFWLIDAVAALAEALLWVEAFDA